MPTIRDQVTGPDAAALLASCEADYGQASQAAHITGGQPLGTVSVTEEAFRWAGWSPAGATVDLVSAGPGSPGRHHPGIHPGPGRLVRAGTGGSSPRPAATGATPRPG